MNAVKQLAPAAYCLALPTICIILPPRLMREEQGRFPLEPLRAQEVKVEVSLLKSIGNLEDVKPFIPFDPRQVSDPLEVQMG